MATLRISSFLAIVSNVRSEPLKPQWSGLMWVALLPRYSGSLKCQMCACAWLCRLKNFHFHYCWVLMVTKLNISYLATVGSDLLTSLCGSWISIFLN